MPLSNNRLEVLASDAARIIRTRKQLTENKLIINESVNADCINQHLYRRLTAIDNLAATLNANSIKGVLFHLYLVEFKVGEIIGELDLSGMSQAGQDEIEKLETFIYRALSSATNHIETLEASDGDIEVLKTWYCESSVDLTKIEDATIERACLEAGHGRQTHS